MKLLQESKAVIDMLPIRSRGSSLEDLAWWSNRSMLVVARAEGNAPRLNLCEADASRPVGRIYELFSQTAPWTNCLLLIHSVCRWLVAWAGQA